ncbi:hypothetical protein niasHT_040183 [Heterodera trifolii]|uniref:Uncharacterized protein n=1 Tax=Heterodera trifolii TaxID=157864 RepID=A0ABD2ICE3_9BILA
MSQSSDSLFPRTTSSLLTNPNKRFANITPPQTKKQHLSDKLAVAQTILGGLQPGQSDGAPQWANSLLGFCAEMVGICRELLSMVKEQQNDNMDTRETLEEERRLHSVVVVNLPESEETVPSARVNTDFVNAQSMLDTCDIECRPCQVYRMGKKSDRPRLMKIEFPTKKHAQNFLRNKTKLKNHNKFNNVLVRPSLSKQRLSERSRLIGICKNDHINNPNSNSVIYAGHVMSASDISRYKSNPDSFKCICHVHNVDDS